MRGVESKKLIPLAEAMYKGGIRLLEVTFDATGKCSDSETAENIKMLCEEFKGRMFIGAGTLLTKKQVELTKLDMVSIPGALTPSEIQNAHRYGADFVKIFPITSLGVDYVKAVKAPLLSHFSKVSA